MSGIRLAHRHRPSTQHKGTLLLGSEGQFRPFEDERRDGYDMLCWLASQSWTNRKIGLLGICYSVILKLSIDGGHPASGG